MIHELGEITFILTVRQKLFPHNMSYPFNLYHYQIGGQTTKKVFFFLFNELLVLFSEYLPNKATSKHPIFLFPNIRNVRP